MSTKVLVLAGSRAGVDKLALGEKVSHKALIDVAGRPMLEHVLTALQASGAGEVIVAADDPDVMQMAQRLGARCIAVRHNPSSTVLCALDELGAPLLVTTADHVLLQASWVDHMIAGTHGETDVAVMMARREQIDAEMPGSKRTYFRFADGEWSGCNMFYFRSTKARVLAEMWQRIEKDRKRPWRIAAGIGLGTLFAMLMGQLSASEAIARVGAKAGARAQLVAAPSGLAAVDVDKAEDLRQVRAYLARVAQS